MFSATGRSHTQFRHDLLTELLDEIQAAVAIDHRGLRVHLRLSLEIV